MSELFNCFSCWTLSNAGIFMQIFLLTVKWNQNQQQKKKLSFVNIYTGVGTRITQLPIKTFSFSFSSSLYDWTAALRSLYTDPVLNISPVLLEKEAFKCRRASLSYNPAEALLLPLADFHRPPHPLPPCPPLSLHLLPSLALGCYGRAAITAVCLKPCHPGSPLSHRIEYFPK